VLERGLGPTICRDFYFPYARKIWGLEPEAISAAQAHKRVSAGSIGKLLRRLLPGGGTGAATSRGSFFYPRLGYGQISEAYADAAQAAGARLQLGARAIRIARNANPAGTFEVETTAGTLAADRVWSTIPNAVLARTVEPAAPADVLAAAGALELRAMLLVYLVVETDRFSEYDAHYFPAGEIPFSRLSEPKNYAADRANTPNDRTVLCAEIPCDTSDAVWQLSDEALGERVVEGLARAGLPVHAPVREVATRRLPAAYPIYRAGYEHPLATLDDYITSLDRILSFGRQGLFAHDNTHHALAMARAAVECLAEEGHFDDRRWAEHRAVFETHVVED